MRWVAPLFITALGLSGLSAQAALVDMWSAEGNTNDSVNSAHNGTAQGGLAYAPGAVGQGFLLNGSNAYVNVANPTDFNAYKTAFTIAGFIRMDATQTTGQSIINLRDTNNSSGFSLEQFFGQVGQIQFATNQSGAVNDYQSIVSSGWNTGTLYHIAATFDSATGTVNMYRNGALVASNTSLPHTALATSASEQMQIGHNIVASSQYWNGLIDEVRYYDSALTQAQIQTLVPEPASVGVIATVGLLLMSRRRRGV